MKRKTPANHCQIIVRRSNNQPIADFRLLYRKNQKQDWISPDLSYNEKESHFECRLHFDGVLQFKTEAEGFEDDFRKIRISPYRINRLRFVLQEKGGEFIAAAAARLRIKKPEKPGIAVKIRAGTSEAEVQAIHTAIEALGFSRAQKATVGGHLQFNLNEGYISKKTEEDIAQIIAANEALMDVGEVLHEDEDNSLLLSPEIYVKFINEANTAQIKAFLDEFNLLVTRKLNRGINCYLLRSDTLTRQELLAYTKTIYEYDLVEAIDHNIAYPKQNSNINTPITPDDTLFPEQWDHKLIDTPNAWKNITGQDAESKYGSPALRIAVIDGGFDIEHPDLKVNLSDGSPKIDTIYDFSNMQNNLDNPRGSHGTNCASAATGMADNGQGIAGVAGNLRLMAIQYNNEDHMNDGDMFQWLGGFDPGSNDQNFPDPIANGADIMTSSWASAYRYEPTNSNALITAFELLTNFGRKGRGILMFFSAGNYNTFYELPNPYGREPRTMAITASTLTGTIEQRAGYSNYGPGVAFCAPSDNRNDGYDNIVHNPPDHYGALTGTFRVSANTQYAKTVVDGDTVVPGTVIVRSANGFSRNDMVMIGIYGEADTEAFIITNVEDPDFDTHYITLNRAPANYPGVGTTVTKFDGNTPGVLGNATKIGAGGVGQNPPTVNVKNSAGYRAADAIFIGTPGDPGAEVAVIASVDHDTHTINLIQPLLKPHPQGTSIYSGPADYVNNFGGTSYATPVAAGIAGLILSVNPGLTWVEVRQIMRDTAIKIDPGTTGVAIGNRRYGMWKDENNKNIVYSAGNLIPLDPVVNNTLSADLTAANAALMNPAITLNNASGFEAGQAIAISGQATTIDDQGNTINEGDKTEFNVIKSVLGNDLTLQFRLVYGYDAGATVTAGRKPRYSAFYGYGRLDANLATLAAIDSLTNFRELLIRNTLGDNGSAATTFVQSPDIWVSNKALTVNGHTFTIIRNAAGLDDLTINNTWTGTEEAEIHIEVTVTPTAYPDLIRYKINNGDWGENESMLTGGNTIANGLVVTFEATTGHKEWDNWTIYVDPTVPGFDYTKDAPHENPDSTIQRFVHARIKNMVSGPLAAQYKNLDAWVRFYILANPAATPLNIKFPDSFNTTNVVADLTDTDNPADNPLNPGNAPNLSIPISYFMGEVEIPAGTIGPSNNTNPNDGVEIVSLPWDQAHIPPEDTEKDLYLMVQVAPCDGRLNGDTLLDNSSISCRQILFVGFNFQNKTGTRTINRQFWVDSFGNAATGGFAVDISVSIGWLTTEMVEMEAIRINDNGTEEKAVFKHNETAWGFDTGFPAWAGLAINAPVETATGTSATGRQKSIRFTGDFQAAKEHSKIKLMARVTSNTAGATVVIAEDSLSVDVVQASELPAAIPAAPGAANPPPRSYAFTDFAHISQNDTQAYGPVKGALSNKFRCTALFTASTDTNAYAAMSGTILVQPVAGNEETVNLILRPYEQAIIGFTPVKYFVYRGLRKDDFFAEDDTKVVPEAGSNSELMARLWEIHNAQNDPGADFLSKALGFDPAVQSGTDKVETFFFRKNPDYQLPFVSRGQQIGRFQHSDNHEFGFEIVLEEGAFTPDLDWARKAEHQVDISGMSSGSSAGKFNIKYKREEILNFIDPAAFYGMHNTLSGRIEYRKNNGSTDSWYSQNIYTHIVSKLHTKNNVYIDIRNENGDSYDFYGNYKEIRIGTEYTDAATNNLAVTDYGSNKWPVHILNSPQTAVGGLKNTVYVEFIRKAYNSHPMVYADYGEVILPAGLSGKFIDTSKLLLGDATWPWTNTIGIQYNNNIPTQGLLYDNIATVIKLHYSRSDTSPISWPDTVLQTNAPTDNVFGPIGRESFWDSAQPIQWLASQDKKYIPLSQFSGYIAERGIAFENYLANNPDAGRIIYFSIAKEYYNPAAGVFQPTQGLTGGVSSETSLFEAASIFQGTKLDFDVLTRAGQDMTTLKLSPRTGNAYYSDSILMLCITKEEQNALKDIRGFHTSYPAYAVVEKTAELQDDYGKPYTTYKLRLQGLDTRGHYKIADPDADIILFSTDGYMFFSKDFVDVQSLPATYIRNAEEHAGVIKDNNSGNRWEDVFIDKDTFGALGAHTTAMPALVAGFQTTINSIANDSNAKTNLEAAINTATEAILDRVREVASKDDNENADDRVLYWARLKMKVVLQSHNHMIQSLQDRNELLHLFETRSRGLGSIDFSATPSGAKKILLIGFDPTDIYPRGLINNVRQSNPSGAVALALHGETLVGDVAFIQSVVLPNRYHELDFNEGEGYVEQFFNRYMDPTDSNYTPVDIIIVLGQNNKYQFDVPRFVCRNRPGITDNNFHRSSKFPLTPNGDIFYQTSLPVSKMVPEANSGTTFNIYFNQTYRYTDGLGNVKSYSISGVDGNTVITNDPDNPVNADQNAITSPQGSAASTLDMEVCYRLCALRAKKNAAFSTGAILLPKIQGTLIDRITEPKITTEFSSPNTKILIDELKEILRNASVS